MGLGRGDYRVTFAVLSPGVAAYALLQSLVVPVLTTVQTQLHTSQTGVASGMNANIRTIGGSIGSALTASIVTSRLLPSGLPHESGTRSGSRP